MLKVLRLVLLPLAILFAIVLWQAEPGRTTTAAGPAGAATPRAENLDPTFWLADKVDLRQAIAAQQQPLDDWIEQINRAQIDFLCVGEIHRSEYRQFLADTLLARLPVDVLMLEADADRAAEIVAAVNGGAPTVNLLGVDIASVVRAVQTQNPAVQILGVDETPEQSSWRNLEQVESDRRRLSRDGFIAQNIRQQLSQGQRTVALFGVNHCAYSDLGLGNSRPFFRHLVDAVGDRSTMHSLYLVASSASANLLALTLQQIGLGDELLVIPDARAIQETVYNYRWDLKAFWDNYDALMYFPVARP